LKLEHLVSKFWIWGGRDFCSFLLDICIFSLQWRVEEEKRADHEDKERHSAANRHWGWKLSIGGENTFRGDADSNSQLPWDLPRRKSKSGSRTGAPRTKEPKTRN